MSKKSGHDETSIGQRLRVEPGEKLALNDVDTRDTPLAPGGKKEGRKTLEEMHERLNELQEVLYAESERALLVVLQALDTGGKDGTIRKVLGPLNPQGVRVTSFKPPTPDELAHDYLWRIHNAVPSKGTIGVFNRSHYEDVLITRVHKWIPKKVTTQRFKQINNFEKHLTENGVTLLKFYLHISREEQRERLQKRLENPEKHWKFSSADLAERELWDDYIDAYDEVLRACTTPWAPWYVIPADRKWYRDFAVGSILLETLEGMDLRYPPPEEGLDDIQIPD